MALIRCMSWRGVQIGWASLGCVGVDLTVVNVIGGLEPMEAMEWAELARVGKVKENWEFAGEEEEEEED